MSANANQKISIHCTIDQGTRPIKIEWMKDGVLIQSNDNLKIVGDDEDSTLSIRFAKDVDAGNYTCVAKNSFGSDFYTAQVVVKGESATKSYPQRLTKTKTKSTSKLDQKAE